MINNQAVHLMALFTSIAITFIGALIYSIEFSMSSFMLWDDNLWLPPALLGNPVPYPTQPLMHGIIGVTGATGAMIAVKLISLLSIALCGGGAYLCLHYITKQKTASCLSAIFISLYPVSVDQTFYVIGSHPTFATMLALFSLYCFLIARDVWSVRAFILIGFSSFLALLTVLSSPMFALGSFLPALWLAIDVTFHWKRWLSERKRLAIFVALAIAPVLVHIAMGMFQNVYSASGDTRIDPALSNAVPGLTFAFEAVLTPFGQPVLLSVVAMILIGMIAILIWRQNGILTNLLAALPFALMMLIFSAVVFAPNIAVNENFLRSRYIVAPFVAAALMIGMFAIILARSRAWSALGLNILLGVGISGAVLAAHAQIYERYGGELASYHAVRAVVSDRGEEWPDNSNILFVSLPSTKPHTAQSGRSRSATVGISYLAGKPLLAAVSPSHVVRAQLSLNGTSADELRLEERFAAAGLRANSPLFVYVQDPITGAFEAMPMLLMSSTSVGALIHPGESPSAVDMSFIDIFDVNCAPLPGFLAFADSRISSIDEPHSFHRLVERFEFDGQNYIEQPLALADRELFRLRLSLRAAELPEVRPGVSRVHPSMPFRGTGLAGSLSAFQSGDVYSFLYDGDARRMWRSGPASSESSVELYGRQGCRIILILNGTMTDVLPSGVAPDHWLLGKGIQERFWRGSVVWETYRQ